MPKSTKPNAGAQLASNCLARSSSNSEHREGVMSPPAIAAITKESKGRVSERDKQANRSQDCVATKAEGSAECNVYRGIVANGKEYIRVKFEGSGLTNRTLDLSFLIALPNLIDPFLSGVVSHLLLTASRSRLTWVSALKRGICTYLRLHHADLFLGDLDRVVLTAYVKWQDSYMASAKQDKPLSINTARMLVHTARTLFDVLSRDPTWSEAALKVRENYPRNTHRNSEALANRREILPRSTLDAIFEAAHRQVEAIRKRFDDGDQLVRDGRERIANGDIDYADVSVTLATLVDKYPGVFPHGATLRHSDPDLQGWVYGNVGPPRARGVKSHGLLRLARYRYACSYDLVPFVLLPAIEGGYNIETLLTLKWSDITTRSLFGIDVITIDGSKGRSFTGRYGKDLDPKVVGPWLALLERITQPLRSAVSLNDKDKVFLFSPERSSNVRAKSFSGTGGPSTDVCWPIALAKFIRENALPRFSAGQIRPTMLDLVGLRHGSLVAQRAAQHRSFATTDGHYLGPGVKEREREVLAETMQHMQRWFESKGSIDVRRWARSVGADKGSATPGFMCADPYDSPWPHQAKHRLCRAYGLCPVCPLALIEESSHEVVGHWLALEKAIYQSREVLDAAHWLQRWAPVASSLKDLLRKVPKTVQEKALALRIKLPLVG